MKKKTVVVEVVAQSQQREEENKKSGRGGAANITALAAAALASYFSSDRFCVQREREGRRKSCTKATTDYTHILAGTHGDTYCLTGKRVEERMCNDKDGQ